jgi:hypothetical protein
MTIEQQLGIWLNTVATWCESVDVPYQALRSEQGDWYAKLEFKDANGRFCTHVPFSERADKVRTGEVTKSGKPRYKHETIDQFIARSEKNLSTACARARAQRVVVNVGIDPRRSKAA